MADANRFSGVMIFPDLNLIVEKCLKRLRRWRVPPHWSWADWQEEVTAHAQSAAWEALGDYDVSRGVAMSTFMYHRVMASVLTRYRQEWSYAVHCEFEAYAGEHEKAIESSHGFLEGHTYSTQFHELLGYALALLSQGDRWLIEQLLWAGRTETEIAHQCGVSQQAISKRKRAILHDLRGWMEAA